MSVVVRIVLYVPRMKKDPLVPWETPYMHDRVLAPTLFDRCLHLERWFASKY